MNNAETHTRRQMPAAVKSVGVLVGALMLTGLLTGLLSGCGVKSAPSHPEGATYPQVYPAPAAQTQPVPNGSTTSPLRRQMPGVSPTAPRPSSDTEYYNPPAPATEILAQ